MNRSQTNTTPARNVRADAFVAQMQRTDRAAVVRAIEQRDMAELERAAIARRIKQARKEAGLSQPEMAEALGVIQRTYQNYESLKEPRTPWALMNQIATVTGKTTEWLIHGDAHTATPALNGAGDDRLSRIEKRLDQLEIAVDHQNANLARQSTILERIESREERQSSILAKIEGLVGVLRDIDIEVTEPRGDAPTDERAKIPPPPDLPAPPAVEPIRRRGSRGTPRSA